MTEAWIYVGVRYVSRERSVGFKAGNVRNVTEHTTGEFLVICDADTRPFPPLLEHFRAPDGTIFSDDRLAQAFGDADEDGLTALVEHIERALHDWRKASSTRATCGSSRWSPRRRRHADGPSWASRRGLHSIWGALVTPAPHS